MPTHMIVVAGPKGGTGKSTTVSNLLVAARMAGLEAVGIDLDPQGSLVTWAQDRAGLAVQPAVTVVPGRLPDWRAAVAAVQATLKVVDLPPGLDQERDAAPLQDLACAADLVLVPAPAEGPSLKKLADVGAAMRQAGAPVAFVLTRIIAGRAILGDARAYLGRRAELLGVEIPQRDAIHRAMDQGLAVVEDPTFGGREQYLQLWRLVAGRLGLAPAEAA